MAINNQKLQYRIQNFMFQLRLYQLKIMKNYCNNWKHVLKEQLTWVNINQNQNIWTKLIFKWLNWLEVKRLFVLSYENDAHGRSFRQYFLLTVKINDYNVMLDGKNVFDQPVKNDLITYENMRKIATGQEDGYTTGCLLD